MAISMGLMILDRGDLHRGCTMDWSLRVCFCDVIKTGRSVIY